ncbi:hypothetical protein N4P33_04920 [Streptomyces sp. 15-116A]|uniref:hypothetical protein n=1 Tax=Streptomyces sp. 15-116A TaxID=2259035 RepID=UPI0021B20D41|nr:hypothetical protein [Streptomyces sp. 15-116A]MCT7351514.1 hypothetical protein [Streptomyces sp. 15-116A]
MTAMHSRATAADATATARAALTGVYGEAGVQHMPRPLSGSEDFGIYGTTAGYPSVFWMWGSAAPKLYGDTPAPTEVPPGIPGNHSPRFAPQVEPVIAYGVRGLRAVAAAFHGTEDSEQG